MNFEAGALTLECLRKLRGDRTQIGLSRALGYDFNKVYRWESGEDIVYWEDFVQICRSQKRDIEKICRDLFHADEKVEDVTLILSEMVRRRSLQDLSKKLSVSRFKLSRYASGKSRLPLELFFRLVDLTTPHLISFVRSVLPNVSLTTLKARIENEQLSERLVLDYPYFEAVLRALEALNVPALNADTAKAIQGLTGVKANVVLHILQRFEKLGIVASSSKGHYINYPRVVFTSQRVAAIRLNSYWLQRVNEYLEKLSTEKQTTQSLNWAHRTLALDPSQKEKMLAAMQRFFENVDTIVQTSGEKKAQKEVFVLSAQVFSPASKS